VASFGLAQYLQPVRHVTTATLWSNRGGLWIEQHVCQRSVDGGRGCAHPAGRLVRCLCPAATFASTAASEDRASAAVKSWLALTAAGLTGAGRLAGHQTYGHSTGIQEQDSLQYWDVTWAASLRTNLEIAGLSSSHQEHSA